MATQVKSLKQDVNVEAVANSFIKDLIAKGLIDDVPVHVIGASRTGEVAVADDVHAFLKTLDQDEAIRFDVSDTEVEDELVHAQPVPPEVDIDLDKPAPSPVILARKCGRTLYYFSGIHQRSKRLLWSTQPHLAHVFADDEELIALVFGFKDDSDLIMRESFENLQLMVLAPSPTPSF